MIDVRPLLRYNGWRGPGEARGGHIPGAVALPSAWLTRLDETELQELLVDKGIAAGSEIVVYGSPEGTSLVRDRIAGSLDAPLRTYARWADWVADESLPLERLARYEKLVHYDWLWELLGGGQPEAAPKGRYLLFHVNFGVPEEYVDGHLPGALYLDTNQLESPRDWNRRSPEDLEAALRALGITSDTTVILYGRDTEGEANEKWPGRRAGQIAATRAALILSYSGVEDVRLLDGGYDAWVQGGHPLETVATLSRPRFPRSAPTFPSAPSSSWTSTRRSDPRRSATAPPSSASAPGASTRRGQRLQLHPAGGPDRGRRLGQLRHRRLPHAALPQPRQHDAAVPRDRRQLGRGRDHARQVGRLLLRHGLAGERDLALRLPDGLAAIAVYDGGWWEWSRIPPPTRSRPGSPPTRDRTGRMSGPSRGT